MHELFTFLILSLLGFLRDGFNNHRINFKMTQLPEKLITYYKIHSGYNYFCCGGKGVLSHQIGMFSLTLILIIGVTVMFLAFECRLLTPILSSAVPIFAVLQFVYVLVILFRVAFTDPGILPRVTLEEMNWIEAEMGRTIIFVLIYKYYFIFSFRFNE